RLLHLFTTHAGESSLFKCFRSIFLLGLMLIFNILLSEAQASAGVLLDGETIEIEVDGSEELLLSYEGEAGDVITVLVDARNDTDTQMSLYNADGDEIARDDNSGTFLNPALIRIALPQDGEYRIAITHYNEGEVLIDEFEVTLYEVDLLNLNNGAQSTTLDGEFQLDRMIFEAEA